MTQQQIKIWHDDSEYRDEDDDIIEWHDGYKTRKAQKSKIKEQLLPIAWHPDRVMDWCMSEDEKRLWKEQIVVFKNYLIRKSQPQGISWPSPRPRILIKISDLFENVFWIIIREMSHEKVLPGWCAFFIPNHFETQRVCDEAMAYKPRMLGYIPDKYKTQKMRIKAVEEDPLQLQYVPDHLRTQEMCIKTAEKNPSMMCHVTDEYKAQEMCIKAVEEDARMMRHVSDHFKTQEMCEKTIEKAPWQLFHVPDHLSTQEMFDKAIEARPSSLASVSDHFKTEEMCIKAVEVKSWLLYHVPDHF